MTCALHRIAQLKYTQVLEEENYDDDYDAFEDSVGASQDQYSATVSQSTASVRKKDSPRFNSDIAHNDEDDEDMGYVPTALARNNNNNRRRDDKKSSFSKPQPPGTFFVPKRRGTSGL